MCYFLLNSKNRRERWAFFHQTYTFVLKFHNITQQFLLLEVQGLVLSPAQGTFATLLILTLLGF